MVYVLKWKDGVILAVGVKEREWQSGRILGQNFRNGIAGHGHQSNIKHEGGRRGNHSES